MGLNAIPDLGTARPDFLDRALVVEASPLYEPLAELAREGFTGPVAQVRALQLQNNPLPWRGNPADFCTAVVA